MLNLYRAISNSYANAKGYAEHFPSIGEGIYKPAYICVESKSKIEIKAEPCSNITFKSERGVPLIANEKDNTIAFNCGTTGRQAIYAYRDSTVVGKVNVQAYSYKDVKVHLVRVNGATNDIDIESVAKGSPEKHRNVPRFLDDESVL